VLCSQGGMACPVLLKPMSGKIFTRPDLRPLQLPFALHRDFRAPQSTGLLSPLWVAGTQVQE
jgi:hypothetical protein